MVILSLSEMFIRALCVPFCVDDAEKANSIKRQTNPVLKKILGVVMCNL